MLLAFLPLLALAQTSYSRTINVTIDDTHGDERTGRTPEYTPSAWWDEYSDNAFDGALNWKDWLAAYNQTLHCSWITGPDDGVHVLEDYVPDLRVSLTFNGTAIYFYIARNSASFAPTDLDFMRFTLDDTSLPGLPYSVDYNRDSDDSSYSYNQLAFSADQLPPEEHRLEVLLNQDSADQLCFDYAIYTMDDDTDKRDPVSATVTGPAIGGKGRATAVPETRSSRADPPRGVLIVAPLVGAVVLAAGFAWCFARRRRRREARGLKNVAGTSDAGNPASSKGGLNSGTHM